MKRRLMYSLCAVFVLFTGLLTVSCGKPPSQRSGGEEGYTVTDAQGTAVRIPQKPERIISLAIYTDEILLGVVPTNRMAAISRFLDDPKESSVVEKAKRVPEKVGNPTVEQIVGWRPDLVIANGWTDMEQVAALRALGIPVVVAGRGESYEDIRACIRLIADSVGESERGTKVLDRMEEILREITVRIDRIPAEERKRVVLLSVMTSYGGIGSAFDDMCTRAGVVNGAAAVGLKNGQPLTKELLVKSNPDILLLPNYDDKGNFDTESFIRGYLDDPALASVKAIRDRRLAYPRESYIYNGSQDFVFGVQELAFIAYGDEFRQEDNRHISFSGEE